MILETKNTENRVHNFGDELQAKPSTFPLLSKPSGRLLSLRNYQLY